MLRADKSEIRERILRLTASQNSRISMGILVGILMLIVVGCAFTGPSQESTNVEAETDMTVADEMAHGSTESTASDNESSAGTVVPDEAVGKVDGENSVGESIDGSSTAESNFLKEISSVFDPEEMISEPRQLTAGSAVLSGVTIFGADGPILDYAGQFIIFHDYFGLVVYDLMERQILQSLNLAMIGCSMTQGDNACEVRVSADGMTVWMHPRARQYMFRYEVEENRLWQLPLVKTFDIDLEAEDLFNRYAVTEDQYESWHSNYLYEEYKDEKGLHTTYIYLDIPGGKEEKLCNLQCVWDDMVFMLGEDATWPEQAEAKEGFPYRSDSVATDEEILYDEPCEYFRISDTYGNRVHPITEEVITHEGIDYAAEEGTEIRAAADGIVYETGSSDEYGIYVVLQHGNGDMTYYFHCRETAVEEGDRVMRGERIATVGSTGRSTGPHLHFALSRKGVFVDPAEYMNIKKSQ